MKEFREKLKVNTVITTIACIILAAATVLFFDTKIFFTVLPDFSGNAGWHGFVSGVSCGMLLVFTYDLVRSIMALRSEEKLKKMYVKDHDERDKQIWSYARSAGARATLMLGVVAGIIAGFFNRIIGLTIIACLLAQVFLTIIFVFYYKRKF